MHDAAALVADDYDGRRHRLAGTLVHRAHHGLTIQCGPVCGRRCGRLCGAPALSARLMQEATVRSVANRRRLEYKILAKAAS